VQGVDSPGGGGRLREQGPGVVCSPSFKVPTAVGFNSAASTQRGVSLPRVFQSSKPPFTELSRQELEQQVAVGLGVGRPGIRDGGASPVGSVAMARRREPEPWRIGGRRVWGLSGLEWGQWAGGCWRVLEEAAAGRGAGCRRACFARSGWLVGGWFGQGKRTMLHLPLAPVAKRFGWGEGWLGEGSGRAAGGGVKS